MNSQIAEINDYFRELKQFIQEEGITNLPADFFYESFKNYYVPDATQNKLINNSTYQQILSTLYDYHSDNFHSSFVVNSPAYGDAWQVFRTIPKNSSPLINKRFKVYLNIKPDQHGNFASSVIKFLIDNKILSISKTANSYRSDSMVLNLTNSDDAQRIINFVYEKGLQNFMGKHQPFIPDYYGIGIVDGFDEEKASYSETIAQYLTKFTNECIRQKRMDVMDFDGFYNSLESAYENGKTSNSKEAKQILSNLKNIKEKENDLDIVVKKSDRQKDTMTEEYQITNIKQLADAIRKLNPGIEIKLGNPDIDSQAYSRIYSSVPVERLVLPNSFYHSSNNSITNKNNTKSGMYMSIEVQTLNMTSEMMANKMIEAMVNNTLDVNGQLMVQNNSYKSNSHNVGFGEVWLLALVTIMLSIAIIILGVIIL